MSLLSIFTIAIDLFLALFFLASLAVSFITFFRKRRQLHSDHKQYHYVVLIPARNEETVIGDLLDSLNKQDYPKDKIDICVLINNCTDSTKAIAERSGAFVLDCGNTVHNKADALNIAFAHYRNDENIDAYIVFDADNIVDKDFLFQVNRLYSSGARVIQGKRYGDPHQTSLVSGFYRIYYAMQNTFYNDSRKESDLSASINGSGWLVDKKTIDAIGFDCRTIAEDFEFELICALKDVPIYYCNLAKTSDSFPDDLAVSLKQRIRWSAGMIQNTRRYELPLIRKAFRGSLSAFDLSLVNLAYWPILLIIPALVCNYIYFKIPINFFTYLINAIILLWIIMVLGAVFGVLKNGDSIKKNLLSIILFPFFILTWIPLTIYAFFLKDYRWDPIRHTHEH